MGPCSQPCQAKDIPQTICPKHFITSLFKDWVSTPLLGPCLSSHSSGRAQSSISLEMQLFDKGSKTFPRTTLAGEVVMCSPARVPRSCFAGWCLQLQLSRPQHLLCSTWRQNRVKSCQHQAPQIEQGTPPMDKVTHICPSEISSRF